MTIELKRRWVIANSNYRPNLENCILQSNWPWARISGVVLPEMCSYCNSLTSSSTSSLHTRRTHLQLCSTSSFRSSSGLCRFVSHLSKRFSYKVQGCRMWNLGKTYDWFSCRWQAPSSAEGSRLSWPSSFFSRSCRKCHRSIPSLRGLSTWALGRCRSGTGSE